MTRPTTPTSDLETPANDSPLPPAPVQSPNAMASGSLTTTPRSSLTLPPAQIAEQVKARLVFVREQLVDLRGRKAAIADDIRRFVTEEADLNRMLTATTPRRKQEPSEPAAPEA